MGDGLDSMVDDTHPITRFPRPRAAGTRLDSWKEIAAYLKRHVTTVRRWEKHEGLPVHRQGDRPQGTDDQIDNRAKESAGGVQQEVAIGPVAFVGGMGAPVPPTAHVDALRSAYAFGCTMISVATFSLSC